MLIKVRSMQNVNDTKAIIFYRYYMFRIIGLAGIAAIDLFARYKAWKYDVSSFRSLRYKDPSVTFSTLNPCTFWSKFKVI